MSEISPYDQLGGADALRRLVDHFYDLIDELPEAASIAHLHRRGHGLAHAREAQYQFLSGFLGGPQLYLEQYGHVNIRQMHEHLRIGTSERDAWLLCMARALGDFGVPAELKERLMNAFSRVAEALRNAE